METYIINKREYKEVKRAARNGDKVVSKVKFYGGDTTIGDIVEVTGTYSDSQEHQVKFQDEKGLWVFTNPTQYGVLEPTNKPIKHEDEILQLENDLADAYEQIDKLRISFADLNDSVDTLFQRTEPLVKLSALFNINE